MAIIARAARARTADSFLELFMWTGCVPAGRVARVVHFESCFLPRKPSWDANGNDNGTVFQWEEEELNRLSASLARARRAPYPGSTSATADETKENTDMNAAIGLGAGKKIIHRRFASSWSNYSNGSSADGDDDILPWEWRECTRAQRRNQTLTLMTRRCPRRIWCSTSSREVLQPGGD